MITVVINMWAVVASTVVAMILGSLWYSPVLFGKMWAKLTGVSTDSMKKGDAWKPMIGMLVLAFLEAYVFAHVIGYSQATTLSEGLQGGFWMWLGFVATALGGAYLFTKKPWQLFAVDAGYHLVSLLLMGAILAMWM